MRKKETKTIKQKTRKKGKKQKLLTLFCLSNSWLKSLGTDMNAIREQFKIPPEPAVSFCACVVNVSFFHFSYR